MSETPKAGYLQTVDGHEKAEQQPNPQSRKRDPIRQKMMLRIDENEAEHQEREDAQLNSFEQTAGLQIARDKQQAHQQLNCNIARRDAYFAASAFTPQHQPAQQRDIVIGTDRSAAFRTCRA